MAFESLSENVTNTGKKTQEFVETTAAYYKLRLFKSAMKFATSLISMLLLGSIAGLLFAFISFGLAMYLSRILGYPSAGFFLMGGFYLIVLLLVYVFGRKMIVKLMLEKFSELIKEEDEISPSEMQEGELSLKKPDETV